MRRNPRFVVEVQHCLCYYFVLQSALRAAEARATYQSSTRAAEARVKLVGREEVARRAREVKKKKEDELLQTMDRDKRRKFEEKLRKEEIAKSLPRMKFKSI
jgi:hypothetical protein